MSSLNTYERALQIYQALIAAAHNRQTLTYEIVGEFVGLPQVGLGMHLEHLLRYCQQNELPHITVLVVRKHEGTPSTGFPAGINPDEERERVFAYDWFKRPPLTEDELRTASEAA